MWGCQTTGGDLAPFKDTVDVTVISFPPGAVIEINEEYKGRTPSTVTLNEYLLERDRNAPSYKVFIYPMENEDYCMQKRALNPYELPDQIIFDLSDCNDAFAY